METLKLNTTITFGKFQKNIVLENCEVESQTEKALMIRYVKDDSFRKEYQTWIPKSVISKAKDFTNYIHLPLWFKPTLTLIK